MEPRGETLLNGLGWVGVSYRQETGMVVLTGFGETVSVRCADAVKLCDWLLRYRAFLRDRAENYVDCRECGGSHHRLVRVCPTLVVRDEEKGLAVHGKRGGI